MKIPFYQILVILALGLFSCVPKQKEQTPKKPNIIFIMSDDHSTKAISAYRGPLGRVVQTPNIDRLANEGALLQNCFAANAICTPSRASILTGQYSHVNGVRTLRDHFDTSKEHVGHYLQQVGYNTALIGKWHLGSEPQGFDHWEVLPGQGAYFDPSFRVKGKDMKTAYAERQTNNYKGYVTNIITDLSLQWLKSRPAEKPFMLMLHHKAPHASWEYDPKYEDMFDGVDIPEPVNLFEDKSHRAPETIVKENNLIRLGKRMSGQLGPSSSLKDYEWPTGNLDISGMDQKQIVGATYQKYLKDYLRTSASVDESVGQILAYLEDTGLDENTIVIYTSDQGMFLGEHQYLDKRWAFEEAIKMPFLVRWPGKIEPKTVVDEMVSNIDFAPTLLDFAGERKKPEMQGKSFKALLEGRSIEGWQDQVYYRYWMHRDMTPAHFAIRTKDHKLIFYYGLNLDTKSYGHKETEPAWELYDLNKDPNEINNVYNDPAYTKIKSNLKTKLNDIREQFGDTDKAFPEVQKRLKETL